MCCYLPVCILDFKLTPFNVRSQGLVLKYVNGFCKFLCSFPGCVCVTVFISCIILVLNGSDLFIFIFLWGVLMYVFTHRNISTHIDRERDNSFMFSNP